MVFRAVGDAVDGGIDEAEGVAGLLVCQGDQGGPERRGGAGAAGADELGAPPGALKASVMPPVLDEASPATSGTPRPVPMPGTPFW